MPQLALTEIDGPFEAAGVPVIPMPLLHGEQPILGFRFGRFAYLTDCSAIPEASFALLGGLDVVVIDALRHRQHPTHFTVAEATSAARRIAARQTYFTHICHDLPHAETSANLPTGMALAHDGLVLEVDLTPPAAGPAPERVMDVVYYPDDPRPPRWMSPVLALGNFDGLHRGHQKIIERIRRGAGERGSTAVVLTFDPHPPRVVRPDKAPPLLMTTAQKLRALDRAGVHGAAVVRFTHELSQWSPERFVTTVLVDWLRVAEVWVGADFLFGRDRAGNFSVLRTLGQQHGFRVEKIDPVRYKEFVVSSTRIRRLVSEGRVDEAGALLGHHYAIDGVVVRGGAARPRIGVSHREPFDRE